MAVPKTDPIVVAPTPTPFDDRGRVDHGALARNVERWLATPLSGFVLGTANGEENTLSEDEKAAIVGTVSRVAGGERVIIAGIDDPSAAGTARLADRYAALGADLVRVRIPRGLDAGAVGDYFQAVAGRAPAPVIVIHQTFDSGPAAPPEVIGAVCSLDNVYGYITDHDIRFEGWVRPLVPQERKFWICNGGLLLHGALLGANGACMWLGNVAPGLAVDIVSMGYAERFAEARPLQATASRLDRVIARHGVAGVKGALELLGFEGMQPRRPAPGLAPEGRAEIEAVLHDTGLL